MPAIAGDGNEPLLLDANAGFFEAQKRGEAYVYVERYAIKKTAYQPLPIGTPSDIRSDAYLVKETNYRDVGGGFVTFDRQFAVVPNSWFDYQQIGVSVGISLHAVTALSVNFLGTNFSYVHCANVSTSSSATIIGLLLLLQFNSNDAGATSSFLSKATRSYVREADLTGSSLIQNVRNQTVGYFFNTTDYAYGDENANAANSSNSVRLATRPGVQSALDDVVTANPTLTSLPNIKNSEVGVYLGDIYEIVNFEYAQTFNEATGTDTSLLFSNQPLLALPDAQIITINV